MIVKLIFVDVTEFALFEPFKFERLVKDENDRLIVEKPLMKIMKSASNEGLKSICLCNTSYTNKIQVLEYMRDSDEKFCVFTNDPMMVSQDFADIQCIFLFDLDQMIIKNIQEYTDKELRPGHNLTKLLCGEHLVNRFSVAQCRHQMSHAVMCI